MSGIEFDIAVIVAVWTAGSALLLVAAGAALRYGVTPVLGAVADLRGRDRGRCEESDAYAEIRLAGIEERLAHLEAATGSGYSSSTSTPT